jgi:hypothetical protein
MPWAAANWVACIFMEIASLRTKDAPSRYINARAMEVMLAAAQTLGSRMELVVV